MASLAVALFGSIITTAVYIWIVWRLDRHEKEPIRMLALAFIWGMLPAIAISVIVEVGMQAPLIELGGKRMGDMLVEAGVAPVVEESAKGLALLAFLVFSYRELDNVLDGIVYGALIGLGFAFTENVLYVLGSIEEQGWTAGLVVLFLRTIVFGVNHAFFTGFTGAAVGAARMTRGTSKRLLLMFTGWLVAVVFHSIHNLGASFAESTNLVSLGIAVLSNSFGVLGLLVIVILVWRKEQHWMREELADEIGVGTLTPEEYGAVNTSSGRQRLLAKTLRRDGWTAYRRLNRLYTLFTELAFKKHQLRSMGSEPGTVREIERLRLAIQKERGDSSGQPV